MGGARQWSLAAGLALLLAGCGSGSGEQRSEVARGAAEVGGRVVSTVDGEAITVDRVRRVARETGLSPREAVRRLQRGILLAREAERRGYGARPEARQAARKAMVQALLRRRVEQAVPPSSISNGEVTEAVDRHGERLQRPERRASVHVLAKVPEDADSEVEQAAKHLAEEALRDFRRGEAVDAVLDRYRSRRGEGFEVVVEELPAVPRDGAFVEPYSKALFEPAETGPLDRPVRTSFGWHAVVLTEIREPTDTDADDVRQQVRERLLTRERHGRLVSLVEALEAEHGVERHPERLRGAFDDGMAAGGEP